MAAIIYTKPNCPYCLKAKTALKSKGIDFTETVIGVDMVAEEFSQIFPDQKTVPLVFIDGNKIGGFNELREWILTEENKQFLTE